MGLDVSHDCFHGGYTGFNVWRGEVAKAAGIPLWLMEGFYGEDLFSGMTTGMPDFLMEGYRYKIFDFLPIKWEVLKPDPIIVLLDHSDCEGDIEVKDCIPLAERLEAIAPLLNVAKFKTDHQAIALQFAKGLRLAASLNEIVTFA